MSRRSQALTRLWQPHPCGSPLVGLREIPNRNCGPRGLHRMYGCGYGLGRSVLVNATKFVCVSAVVLALGLCSACAQAQRGWTTHRDPSGFSLQFPSGWRLSAETRDGRVEVLGAGGERLAVWPVFIPGAIQAPAAARVLRKLADTMAPGVAWAAPQAVPPAAVRLAGRQGGRIAVAAMAWIPSPKGCAGYAYLVSAPEASYRKTEEVFAQILSSFRISAPAPAQKPAPSLRYVRWHDPRENAFSLEVPDGWTMSGGLIRRASVQVQGAWEAVSPDGRIRISGGDPDLPYFTEPTQMLLMTGFREGSWYSPGYGVAFLVRRYVPGAAFAREYVMQRAARLCSGVTVTENRELPEAVAAINAVYAQHAGLGVALSLTAGEAAFTCEQQGRPIRGYYFAGTQRTQVAGMPGGIWNVEHLAGFLASEDRLGLAREVFDHMLKSIELNPQWVAMQQNITASTSRIVSRTHAEISRIIDESYWSRQAVMDELSRRRSNVILGVEDVIDPVTGRELKVESGSNYYWIDHRGTIVGTETDTRPSLDFRELIRLP